MIIIITMTNRANVTDNSSNKLIWINIMILRRRINCGNMVIL